VNVLDPQKLYYITDKFDRFYSLSRYENYVSGSWEDNTPSYLQFGPYYTNYQPISKIYSLWSPEYGYQNTIVETVGNHGF